MAELVREMISIYEIMIDAFASGGRLCHRSKCNQATNKLVIVCGKRRFLLSACFLSLSSSQQQAILQLEA